jgi:predicted ATP-dependent endonuclease of OLD family
VSHPESEAIMKWVYVDNFRGFSDEFIPLADVNFLLGENSTGKSSILALLRLFGFPPFWLSGEFNTDDYQFGNFSDIVSVNASDRTVFRIGYIDSSVKTARGKEGMFVSFFEYIDKEGVPSINRYCYATQFHAVQVIFDGNRVRYRADDIKFDVDKTKTIRDAFKTWIAGTPDMDNTIVLRGPKQILRDRALPFIKSLIDGEAKKKKKDENDENVISVFLEIPDDLASIAWIAPIRTKPRRTYDQFKYSFSPEGDHSPYVVRQFLNRKNRKSIEFQNTMSEYGRKSGLMSSVGVKNFGKDFSSPFQLEIVLEDKPLNIGNVGYGVSQALPVLVELIARTKGACLAIQQPEVHLHPRAQAALGELFYSAAAKDGKKLFIETHSDFIVDRFRATMRNNDAVVDAQALFFERKDGFNRVHTIPIHKDGKYDDNQPDSFRKFFIREELDMLRIR